VRIHTHFSDLLHVKNNVVTIGTFDGVHLGHCAILERLKTLTKKIGGESVLLTFYPHPRMILHPEDHNIKLLNSPNEKANLLEKAGIDHLMIHPFSAEFSRLSPFDYVRDLLVTGLHAHTIIVGYDHRFGRNREGNHQTLLELSETFGFQVEEIPAHMIDNVNVSSTKIRNALQSGAVKEANKYLGYSYSISGTVANGDGLGRTFGFPTANISVDYAYKLIPANGVYSVHVLIGQKKLQGVMSIGVRPTINDHNLQTLEVFIFDFNENIYGEKINVELVEYIRPEMKFGSIDEMKQWIERDILIAKSTF
jgi:riboflavin kinase/FMN adenylyltransferase